MGIKLEWKQLMKNKLFWQVEFYTAVIHYGSFTKIIETRWFYSGYLNRDLCHKLLD